MDEALGGTARASDNHVEGAEGLGCGAVQADPAVESADRRQILLETASGLEAPGGEESCGVVGELVAGDGEVGDAHESAVRL